LLDPTHLDLICVVGDSLEPSGHDVETKVDLELPRRCLASAHRLAIEPHFYRRYDLLVGLDLDHARPGG
jgi:hypothetical protein